MPSDAFCPSCGEILPILAERDEVIRDQAVQMSALRGTVRKLRNERDQHPELDPHAGDARKVFEYWRQTIAPLAREFGDDRFRAVVARLRAGHDVDSLKRAIDGARARPRGGSKTDLITICRNEPNLLMFIDFDRQERAKSNGHGNVIEAVIEDDEVTTDDIARAIAGRQMDHLDSQALLGKINAIEGENRRVIETVLRLAAREQLEAT
jgi:hypothetical protein